MRYRAEKHHLTADGHRMKLYVLRPTLLLPGGAPGVLWIHGGGYVIGMSEMVFFSRAMDLVKSYGAVVVAPEYRLAGQAPYPAALHDCYEALLYLLRHAEELGVRRDQIMVGGESAGGGLTAALCMYARDRNEVRIAYQMPLYPMLDSRDTPSSAHNHAPVWNTRRNHWGWRHYLKDLSSSEVPYYASPARCTDYSGLPPAYSFVGDIEPFYCETLAYIENLKAAGVEAAVDIYPGCFHAFDMLRPDLPVSKQAIRAFNARFEYAMTHYFSDN